MPSLSEYPIYAWQLISGWRGEHERTIYAARERDLAPLIDLGQPRRILDVANGRLRPQQSLLRTGGHQVYGIDYVNRPGAGFPDRAYRVARRIYAWNLGLAPEAMAPDRLICGDVGRLPFPDGFFDMAVSAAAFEHFLDVPAVVRELQRVVRPGGLVWVLVHLFTSPSGGHNVTFTEIPLRSIPAGVEPWDHLRRRRLPFSVPLNEWRRDQYLAAFGECFELVKHYPLIREGEHLLTPELSAELGAYDREELTSLAYIIVARRPAR